MFHEADINLLNTRMTVRHATTTKLGMQVMLLENFLTPVKLVNESLGTVVDMVVNCNSEVFDLNDQYIQ
jgi:hypothetical protein